MNPWNFFDAIYCINLERDVKRRRNSRAIFEHFQIPVTFFKAIADTVGNRGCLASHRALYNLALDQGFQKILIFEDDIIPASGITPEKVRRCTDFMDTYDWDLFYLGAVPNIFGYFQHPTEVKNIYRIKGLCTHAYALNRRALEKLKNIQYDPESPLDYALRDDDTLESFAVYPSLFYQETGYPFSQSVITAGLRINEGYAYYVGFPAKPILVVLALLLILGAVYVIFRPKVKKS